jgi:hypothetical protein
MNNQITKDNIMMTGGAGFIHFIVQKPPAWTNELREHLSQRFNSGDLA